MEIINVAIKELKINEKNPRKITKRELNKLVRSITEFGFVDPIIVNKNKARYNIVVGGHQRLKAAVKLKLKTVPVTYVDLSEEKEQLLNISLNEISGEWDDDKLYTLLKELEERGVDLTLSGFDEPLLDEILARNLSAEKEASIDIIPRVPEKPISQPGEVYILGEHRVMCGDSTKEADFKTLMKDKIADLCWTDPGDVEKDKIFEGIFKCTKKNGALYICYDSLKFAEIETGLITAGFKIKQTLIWEKGHTLGIADYHISHEPILYCRKKEENTEWFGDGTHKTVIQNATIENLEELKKDELINIIAEIRRDSDLIKEKKDPSNQYLHSTQKPVALSQRMIKNSSRPGELILEPCGGSGSVLMACETSGRKCYTMELDAKYVDVIITRWANFTEKDPIRESDGKKWSELK